jgi:S-adenosyl-L-methionine hydrolase (adenosine-forming)
MKTADSLPLQKNYTFMRKLSALLLLLILIQACTKTETSYYPAATQNLVIISDNTASSDMIVGIMGAVRSAYPTVHIDFFNSKSFDVYEGSYLLYLNLENYPAGTYIAGIVEPGAQSKRIIYQANNEIVLAPDNMLSTRILDAWPKSSCTFVNNPAVLEGSPADSLPISEFYKRAILSMLSGTPVTSFGSLCSNPQKFIVQHPEVSGDTLKGEILYTDNFGNCTTNIPKEMTADIPVGTLMNCRVDTAHLTITMGLTYSTVGVGENVCFVNGTRRLQLSINYGNFSTKYHATASSKVFIIK